MDTREDRVFAQFQKVCQKVWLSSKSMPDYITLKKCSTQYVAHFMWLTKSLKIGEYATICSTLYVLPRFILTDVWGICAYIAGAVDDKKPIKCARQGNPGRSGRQ